MMKVSIRCAEDKDAATVAGFVHALIDELTGGAPPAIEEIVICTKAVLAEPGVLALVAWADKAPVGAMTLNECAAIYAGGKFGEISELYVRPENRSQGIAGQLLKHALAEACNRGWKRLEVGAPEQPAWHRTLNFYLRNGFAEIGPRLRLLL